MKLGMMGYGRYIDSIANSIGEYKKYEREVKHKVDLISGNDLNCNMSWTWLFMRQSLLFLGCGLSDAEWTIRWLLTQRKRNFAKQENREYVKPIFILANKENAVNLQKYTFWGCSILECQSYSDGWDRIYGILNGSESTTLRT